MSSLLCYTISVQRSGTIPRQVQTNFDACKAFLGPMDDGPRKPSDAQLKFAAEIAEEIGESIPKDALEESKSLTAWIDANKSKMKPKPASPKQLDWVRKLVTENDATPPEGYPDNLTMEAAAAFLDAHFGKTKSGSKRSGSGRRKAKRKSKR